MKQDMTAGGKKRQKRTRFLEENMLRMYVDEYFFTIIEFHIFMKNEFLFFFYSAFVNNCSVLLNFFSAFMLDFFLCNRFCEIKENVFISEEFLLLKEILFNFNSLEI